MKTQINSTLLAFVHKNASMSSYLSSLLKGRKATPHSWLYEDEDSNATLQRWLRILPIANGDSALGVRFTQFDRKQIEKFGPQGEVPPVSTELAQSVLDPLFSQSDYDDELKLQQYFDKTKAFAAVLFGARLMTKRRLSIKQVVDDMQERDTLTTNSGFPRFNRRERMKTAEMADATSGAALDYPAILLYRQYNGKLRPVWMYPMSMNLLEGQFTQAIQDAIRSSLTPWVRAYVSPWEGYEEVKATLTKQWTSAMLADGGDTTAMDAHMRRAQMRLVFEIVKWLFQRSEWDQLLRTIMRTNEIPLLISPTEMMIGAHGLASGAGWTQLSETVLQMFMAWLEMSKDTVVGQGIGDDFYWFAGLNADKLVKALAKFGLPANPSKQSVSAEELPFLQRLHHRGFFSRDNAACLGGYYPTIRALNSSLNPEKFHKPSLWNSDMFCVRQFMILENCVDDPCFDEFLKFVVKGNKDLLPFAKQQASHINAAQRKARLIPGLNPSYNQEKRFKPLSTFTSIKLASKLA